MTVGDFEDKLRSRSSQYAHVIEVTLYVALSLLRRAQARPEEALKP